MPEPLDGDEPDDDGEEVDEEPPIAPDPLEPKLLVLDGVLPKPLVLDGVLPKLLVLL